MCRGTAWMQLASFNSAGREDYGRNDSGNVRYSQSLVVQTIENSKYNSSIYAMNGSLHWSIIPAYSIAIFNIYDSFYWWYLETFCYWKSVAQWCGSGKTLNLLSCWKNQIGFISDMLGLITKIFLAFRCEKKNRFFSFLQAWNFPARKNGSMPPRDNFSNKSGCKVFYDSFSLIISKNIF